MARLVDRLREHSVSLMPKSQDYPEFFGWCSIPDPDGGARDAPSSFVRSGNVGLGASDSGTLALPVSQ